MSKVKPKKSSTNDGKDHYLKVEFWTNPSNHFWENGFYSEKGKEYFRNSVSEMITSHTARN